MAVSDCSLLNEQSWNKSKLKKSVLTNTSDVVRKQVVSDTVQMGGVEKSFKINEKGCTLM